MNSKIDMKTVCFGEHQINLPQGLHLSKPGSSATFYYGHDADFTTVEFQVVGEDIKLGEFIETVEHRVGQIASKMNEATNGPMLVAREDLGDDATLLRYFENRLSDDYHVHEVHRLIDGTHIFLKADSFEGRMAPVETRLKLLSASVSPVSEEINAPGFCFGPVAINSKSDYQLAFLHYRDERPGHRDVSVEIEVNTLPQNSGEPRLINRIGGNFLGLGFSPHVLKKGKTQLASMAAEQWLGRDSEEKLLEHLFVIDSYPEKPAPRTPGLQITLETGGVPRAPVASGLRPYIDSADQEVNQEDAVTSSLSDEEAIRLWDAMVASVRARH